MRGVEIGSIGKVASAAPAVGMRLGAIGVPLSVSRIVNPGIGPIFKPAMWGGNKVPEVAITPRAQIFAREFSPIRITRVEVPKPQTRTANVIAEVERIIAVAKKPAVLEKRIPVLVRFPNPILASKIEAAPQSILQSKTESRPASRVVRTTSTPAQRVVQTERIVEEKKAQSKRSEKAVTLRLKIVEAARVTEARKRALTEAIRRTKEKTGFISGRRVLEFLSVEFWKYISPLVGKSGKDGTIDLTLRAIANSPARYDSPAEAQKVLSQFVEEHIPLEKGEGGRIATIEEVREVLTGKEKESLKSQALAEIVITRVVEEKEEVIGEPTLKSLGLEELFQKAA